MLVYLPSIANQNPRQVAAAVTALAADLSAAVPGPPLEASFYRRPEDVLAFAAANRARVAFVLCDAPLLLDLGSEAELEPLFRFSAGGTEAQRKIVIVKSDGPKRLADLKGKVLAAVPAPSRNQPAYLARVFDDLLPRGFFSRVEPAQDDFAATASVLYGGVDSALVSEQNPLAAAKLGTELRSVHVSAPVSLPILAARRSLVSAKLEDALARRLAGLSSRPEGRAILAGLRIDGLRPIEVSERSALLKLSPRKPRALEVAVADPSAVPLPPAPAPSAKDLPFVAALPLPEVPIVREERTAAQVR